MVFYTYSIIGLEIFNSQNANFKTSQYDKTTQYADFDSFGSSLLLLFQIMTEGSWSYVIYDHSIRFGSFFIASLYFISFHVIIILVLLSLVKGYF